MKSFKAFDVSLCAQDWDKMAFRHNATPVLSTVGMCRPMCNDLKSFFQCRLLHFLSLGLIKGVNRQQLEKRRTLSTKYVELIDALKGKSRWYKADSHMYTVPIGRASVVAKLHWFVLACWVYVLRALTETTSRWLPWSQTHRQGQTWQQTCLEFNLNTLFFWSVCVCHDEASN